MKKTINNLQINTSIFKNKKFKLYAGLAVTALSITALLSKANVKTENINQPQTTKLEQMTSTPSEIKCNFSNNQIESSIIILNKEGEIVAIIGNEQDDNLTAYLTPGEYIIIGKSTDEAKKDPTLEIEITDYNEKYELYINNEMGNLQLVKSISNNKIR